MTYTHSTNLEGHTIGRNMMFADGIGFATPDAKTAAEALTAGHLNWSVELRADGYMNAQGLWVEDPSKRKIVRTDLDAPLGTVGTRYAPIQNVEMFEWCDTLVDDYGAKYESAWSMHDGREVGLTMRFPDTILIGGNDPYAKFLLLRARHDGKGSVLAVATDVRIRCTNMLNVAVKGATNRVTIPHLTNASKKLAAARETFELTFKYQEAFEAEMEKLLQRELDDSRFRDITKQLMLDQRWGGLEQHSAAIVQLRADSPTLDDEYRQSAYGAFQAITEWTDWVREAKSPQGRAHDMLDGRVMRLKNAALEALSLA